MTYRKEELRNGLRVLSLENEWLSISILPEVGGKISSLIDKQRAMNVLWENPRIQPQRFPIDSNFDNYWCGGWDDVFPTADACVHKGESYPNVGELRSLNWAVEDLSSNDSGATVRLSAHGPISAIKATKTISLVGKEARLHFEIESEDALPLDYIWGTHPSFAIEAGTRFLIPAKTGIVGQASNASLGIAGQRYDWPMLPVGDTVTDMSYAQGIHAGVACGHYATDLLDGWYAVETDGAGVLMEFPVETCPCLWLWLVYGGWRGYHHAILEPWTGYPVNLERAVELGSAQCLMPGEKFAVTIRCTTYGAPETATEALARLRRE